MKQNILLDTGPLVASINKNDRFFDWAKNQFDSFKPPLLTCETSTRRVMLSFEKIPQRNSYNYGIAQSKNFRDSFSFRVSYKIYNYFVEEILGHTYVTSRCLLGANE